MIVVQLDGGLEQLKFFWADLFNNMFKVSYTSGCTGPGAGLVIQFQIKITEPLYGDNVAPWSWHT